MDSDALTVWWRTIECGAGNGSYTPNTWVWVNFNCSSINNFAFFVRTNDEFRVKMLDSGQSRNQKTEFPSISSSSSIRISSVRDPIGAANKALQHHIPSMHRLQHHMEQSRKTEERLREREEMLREELLIQREQNRKLNQSLCTLSAQQAFKDKMNNLTQTANGHGVERGYGSYWLRCAHLFVVVGCIFMITIQNIFQWQYISKFNKNCVITKPKINCECVSWLQLL